MAYVWMATEAREQRQIQRGPRPRPWARANVAYLLHEERIGRQFEGLGSMRLHPEQLQIALHRTLGHTRFIGQPTYRPMRPDSGSAQPCCIQQLCDAFVAMRARWSGFEGIVQPTTCSWPKRLRQFETAAGVTCVRRAISRTIILRRCTKSSGRAAPGRAAGYARQRSPPTHDARPW